MKSQDDKRKNESELDILQVESLLRVQIKKQDGRSLWKKKKKEFVQPIKAQIKALSKLHSLDKQLKADGREVHISMIYPCLMGSIMLGSVAASWLLCGPYFYRPEMYLTAVFVTASFSLAIPAYDYQDIGLLVALFCLFNVCVGIISPSLARLRSIYVPNDLRASMISLSRVPANAVIIFVLIKGGYYHNLNNSTTFTFCVIVLLTGAGCLHLLNRWSCVANDKLPMERP